MRLDLKRWQGDGIFTASHGAMIAQYQLDRREQEDAAGTGHNGDDYAFVVCDGMGGHDEGAKASAVAVSAFLTTVLTSPADPRVRLDKAVRAADKAVRKLSGRRRPGSTLVGVLVTAEVIAFAHVGDSRAWVALPGDDCLLQVTRDHNVAEDLRSRGGHPGYGSNVLTRALGAGDDPAQPDVRVFDRAEVRVVLLASDGLHGALARRLDYDESAVEAAIRPGGLTPPNKSEWLSRMYRGVASGAGTDRLDNLTMLAWLNEAALPDVEHPLERVVERVSLPRA